MFGSGGPQMAVRTREMVEGHPQRMRRRQSRPKIDRDGAQGGHCVRRDSSGARGSVRPFDDRPRIRPSKTKLNCHRGAGALTGAEGRSGSAQRKMWASEMLLPETANGAILLRECRPT